MPKERATSLESYLKPTEAINCDHEAIQAVAKKLTLGYKSDIQKATKLFYFVRDSIQYDFYTISIYFDDYKASVIITREKGFCVQKAVLLAALGRAAKIPSRLCFAKIRNHRMSTDLVQQIGTNILSAHAYNQFYLNGKWVNIVATFDKEFCQRNGLPTVEFDGVHNITLPKKDLDGNLYIEYLEKYEPQEDVPFEWVVKEICKINLKRA